MGAEIAIRRAGATKSLPAAETLGFGKIFTDHMFLMDWNAGRGWHDPRIVPYGPLTLDPAAAVFHYAQELFEGCKAFRGRDGKVRLFRLSRHCERMKVGAGRLCLPSVEPTFLSTAIRSLIEIEERWVPAAEGSAMYVRPTIIATEPFLGVRPAEQCLFFIILSPVGAYYPEGLAPVKIWIEREKVRAAPGGLGAVKAGANYAASLLAADEAKKKGYTQVLWLDATEHRYLEEVGTMNLFVHLGDEIVTPPLEGTILGGVTRDSVIALLHEWRMPVTERRLSIDEIEAAHRAGSLREVFGTGTAAVISPVGELGLGTQRITVGDGALGPLARRLYDEVTGIQYGTIADRHGWMTGI